MKKQITLEQDEDNYYRRLEIKDRLIDHLYEKYGSLYQASIACGKSKGYVGNFNTLFRINSLYEFCRISDISLEYILTGKNKSGFTPVEITYQNILKEYYAKRKPRHHSAIVMAVFKIKHQTNPNFGLNTLLTLSDHFKKDIYYLIRG